MANEAPLFCSFASRFASRFSVKGFTIPEARHECWTQYGVHGAYRPGEISGRTKTGKTEQGSNAGGKVLTVVHILFVELSQVNFAHAQGGLHSRGHHSIVTYRVS
jgi:hypothetical protein